MSLSRSMAARATLHRATIVGVVQLLIWPAALSAQPIWASFGLDSLYVFDLHRSGTFLYATTGEDHDGIWRRDVSVPESAWVQILDLEGVTNARGVWSPWANPDVIYATGFFGPASLWMSDNGGASWTTSDPSPSGATRVFGNGDGNVMFLGGAGGSLPGDGVHFRSTDSGSTWDCVYGCAVASGYSSDIASRPGRDDEVWVVVNTGFFTSYVVKSVDGGDAWTEVWTSFFAAGSVDIGADGVAILANELEVVRSTDGGQTWWPGPIGNLRSVRSGPWAGDVVLAGGYATENVYLSEDDGVTWQLLNGGLPTGGFGVWAIEPDPVYPGVFYIGTQPYGVWRIELPGIVGVSELENPTPVPLRVLSNPARGALRIALDAPRAERLDVFDAAGRRVWTTRLRAGVRELTWDGRLQGGGTAPPGTYFLRVPGVAARSFVWLGP